MSAAEHSKLSDFKPIEERRKAHQQRDSDWPFLYHDIYAYPFTHSTHTITFYIGHQGERIVSTLRTSSPVRLARSSAIHKQQSLRESNSYRLRFQDSQGLYQVMAHCFFQPLINMPFYPMDKACWQCARGASVGTGSFTIRSCTGLADKKSASTVLEISSWLSTWMITLHPIHFPSAVNFAITIQHCMWTLTMC